MSSSGCSGKGLYPVCSWCSTSRSRASHLKEGGNLRAAGEERERSGGGRDGKETGGDLPLNASPKQGMPRRGAPCCVTGCREPLSCPWGGPQRAAAPRDPATSCPGFGELPDQLHPTTSPFPLATGVAPVASTTPWDAVGLGEGGAHHCSPPPPPLPQPLGVPKPFWQRPGVGVRSSEGLGGLTRCPAMAGVLRGGLKQALKGDPVHPRSWGVLLQPGGVAVPDGRPMTANVVPGGSCTTLLPASGSSAVLGRPPGAVGFGGGWGTPGAVGARRPGGSLPAPPSYQRHQPERRLPRAPCPNSRLIPRPAPTRPRD